MKILFLVFAGLILFSCVNTPVPIRLILSDEFTDSGSPDSTKWSYDLGDGCPNLCGWGNNDAQIYTRDPKNVRVENGFLIIDALKENGQWTSARLTSKSKMNFTYGRIEFRAKLPDGVGTWPALWMLGESVSSKGWPACGEVDVMEHVGRNPRMVQSVLHTPSSFGNTINKKDTLITTYNSDFHIYGANWTKEKIEFFIDGVTFYRYQPATKDDSTWPFDLPFFIIMNIAMGGNLGGPIDNNLSQARMEVDYVRVYQ